MLAAPALPAAEASNPLFGGDILGTDGGNKPANPLFETAESQLSQPGGPQVYAAADEGARREALNLEDGEVGCVLHRLQALPVWCDITQQVSGASL